MKEDIRGNLFQSIVNFARTKFPEEIDKAYEYFFDEDEPKDMLAGTALDLAFINFEDWLVCDYRNHEGLSMIDLFQCDKGDLTDKQMQTLDAMKNSYISLYEVVSSNGGTDVTVKDILLGDSLTTDDEMLRSLPAGDVFATRFVMIADGPTMLRCVYPFGKSMKDKVLSYVDIQYNRYKKNKNPEGDMKKFLNDEDYLFNLIWLNSVVLTQKQGPDAGN